jgi:hypothetical protein
MSGFATSGRVAGAALIFLVLAGCQNRREGILGSQRGYMESPAPVVVCGTELSGPQVLAPNVFDISMPGTVGPFTVEPTDGLLFVKTSKDCSRGAELSISPPGVLAVVRTAPAKDGRPAAVVLRSVNLKDARIAAEGAGTLVVEGASP